MREKIIITVLVSLITMMVGGVLIFPKNVEAQIGDFRGGDLGYDLTTKVVQNVAHGPFDDVGEAIRDIFDVIKTGLLYAYQQSADIFYKNSLRYFLNKIAYDTATYIATGSPGQKPLFVTDWKAYFQQTGDEALGDFFYRLGKESWGKDLCEPLDPLVKINLTVAAKKTYAPKQVQCKFSDILKNINDLRDMKFSELVEYSDRFQPSGNDLGVYLTIRSGAYAYKSTQENQSKIERLIEGSIKSVVDPVTEVIKTPSNIVQKIWEKSVDDTTTVEETRTGNPVADAVGVFTNTLVSKYLERIFKEGFNPEVNRQQVLISDIWTLGGVRAAQLFFGELAEINYSFNQGVRMDMLSLVGPEQFNQVVDESFARAIELKCTVGQAVKNYYYPGDENYRAECNGLISGAASFGYTSVKDTEPDYRSGIPYRSILVLRKFRVVPVGWELAAQYYNDYGRSSGQLQDGVFNLNFLLRQHDQRYIDGDTNKPNPYYKLVDPDWLLKFPLTRCTKEGAGPIVPQETVIYSHCADLTYGEEECPADLRVYIFQRQDYCADYETCLDDTSGKCDPTDWGYCIEENPVWNFQGQGQECGVKYYATCQSLVRSDGAKFSYNLNTLNGYTDKICDDINAGCREYCQKYNLETEEWECDATTGDKIYLTSSSEECKQTDEGCSLVYSSFNSDSSEVQTAFNNKDVDPNAYGLLEKNYIKLASDAYYNCRDYTIPVSGIAAAADCVAPNFWREDLNICVLSGSEECADFVKYCRAIDMNCELYTPSSYKGPAVPATILAKDCSGTASGTCADETDAAIVWNNECPAVCVSYQPYHQEETQFELAEEVDFITSSATSCSQPGCDQFTNLDEVARGGEGIEYYSYLRECIKPEDGGWSTYYTWEGSDTAGYQLRKWELKSSGGGPAGTVCTDLADEDCREFFDQNLISYKRLYSTTVVVTEDCHPFRRTLDDVVYRALPAESMKCSASNNMCREYKSNEGYNYQNILTSYFERQDTEGWNGGTISNESVRRGDYSLAVSGTIGHDLAVGDLEEGSFYSLEFLAKGSGTISAQFFSASGTDWVTSNETSALGSEWQFYVLRLPATGWDGLSAAEAVNDKIAINNLTGSYYIDNIVLKKMNSLLVIKDSWETPKVCDSPTSGFHLGCDAYKDRSGKIINLKEFNKLCFEDVVGCEQVIVGNNSSIMTDDSLDYLVLDAKFSCDDAMLGCTRLGLMTPDRDFQTSYEIEDIYKIINPDEAVYDQCRLEEVFCQSYIDADGKNYYFKDPGARACSYVSSNNFRAWLKASSKEPCYTIKVCLADTGQSTCNSDSDCGSGSCDAIAGKFCLADPDQPMCEEDADCTTGTCDVVPLTASVYYPKRYCLGGVSKLPNNECTEDADCTDLANPGSLGICTSWAGICEATASGCREYQDPQDPEACNKDYRNYEDKYGLCHNNTDKLCEYDSDCVSGVCDDFPGDADVCSYYYYKEVEECGAVNPAQGCVGFYATFEYESGGKTIRSYKVCEDDVDRLCEEDADCPSGRCVYTNTEETPLYYENYGGKEFQF